MNIKGRKIDLNQMRKSFLKMKKADIGAGDPWLNEDFNDFKTLIYGLDLKEGDSLLYIGAGSGFGPYVASEIVGNDGRVYAYEINSKYAQKTEANLKAVEKNSSTRLENIELIIGDGFESPYTTNKILVCAGCPERENKNNSMTYRFFYDHLNKKGIAVVPFGELGVWWHLTCYANVYRIEKKGKKMIPNKMTSEKSSWYFLEGKYGFTEEEKKEALKESSLSDDLF